VGLDEDGDDITSCVVEPASITAGSGVRLSGNVKRGFQALAAMAPDNKPVAPEDWKGMCVEFLGGKNVNARFFDLKKALLQKGCVVVDKNGFVTRRME